MKKLLNPFVLCSYLLVFCSLSIVAQENNTLINVNPDPSGEPWIAGGISYDEWSAAMQNAPSLSLSKTKVSTATLPTKVDNTTYPAFRPIFNQSGGSCAQASGIGYQYTYEINTLRNLPSNVLINQYPYDFTYNFLNGGSGDRGSISTDGWDIVKANGVPDAQTYGGFGLGKHTRWVSGYDVYYKGMSNRLGSYFSIKIRTAADIEKMKQFLFDHANGSAQGGILNYAADYTGTKIISLASGTPEAGKKAIVSFGNGGGHAMTIAGYNDSIRYDFNGDGRYTNNIDITGDGVIDVRDWEIGAALMVNSWGTSWGSSGKAYLMYKKLADAKASGGIWNNTLSGITITDTNVKPQLTYKVKMNFNPRSNIRIKAGYSTNASASTPSFTKTFGKSFYLAGGAYPMQGINNEALEFGLDVSDFLPKITTPEAAFFLQIEASSGSGNVAQFSLIDYSSGEPVETVCSNQNVPIGVGTTVLKIVKTSASFLVVSPNGGEKWERNRPFKILWSSKDATPVTIELLKAGVLQQTIASSAPGNGSFLWNIPSQIPIGDDYSIRIRNSSKSDVSDKTFSIEDQSQLELVTPNGGDYLIKGKTSSISWKSNISGFVKIDLYRHGVFQKKIDSINISNSSYTWTIPENTPSGFDYQIRLTSGSKDWLFDESDSSFGIGFSVVNAPYTQTFDEFISGESLSNGWEQILDDDINWTVYKGATPSKVNPQAGGTGPDGDHTSGSGTYLYVESSTPNNPGKEAFLLSPVINIKDIPDASCSFWCHMLSKLNHMGALWVDVNVDGVWKDSVMYLTGDHGDKWFIQTINLSPFKANRVQLRFRVLTGTDYDSDICIDDFSVGSNQTALKLPSINTIQRVIRISDTHISLSGYSGEIAVYSINGKQVLREILSGKNKNINISRLSTGTYFFKVNGESFHFIHR